MAKNVQAEKERRQLAQTLGQHLSPQELQDVQSSLQRSTDFLSAQDKLLLSWKPFVLKPNKQQILFQGAFLDKQLPPRLGVPEVCFLGRSNVGKSSLLNRLVGKSDLARVGKTPGATASVNLYGIFEESKTDASNKQGNDQKPLLGLVDLPGFGYAKLNKATKESVQETAEYYLEKRKELALGVLLVDCRRVPSVDDKAVLAALFDMGIPLIVCATKVDKLSSQRQIDDALNVINKELGLPEEQPLCVSSVTGLGIKDLWRIILEACEGRVEELRETAEQGDKEDDDNPMLLSDEEDLDDDSEVSYSQGYDWVHGSVMYEAEEGELNYNDDDDEAESWDNETDHDDDDDGMDDVDFIPQKQSLKFLRKKAREMERRGEL
jgi:GTP-binding protein